MDKLTGPDKSYCHDEAVHCVGDRTILLDTPQHFSFSEILQYLTRSPNECLYLATRNDVTRLVSMDGVPVLFEVTQPDERVLQVCVKGSETLPHILAEVVKYVREWFDMDRDITEFYEMASSDSLLAPLVSKYCGLRVVAVPDLFEALAWAIMGQQINLSFAYTLKRRFVESFGTSQVHVGQTYWMFPRAETVASLTVEDLRQIQFSTKKAEYMLEVANQMAEGALTKELLQQKSVAEAEAAMVAIRGIGPWTANYVRMRCLKDPTAFPVDDVGLQNAIRHQRHMDHKPTRTEVRAIGRPWANWEAYATFYLWRSLQVD